MLIYCFILKVLIYKSVNLLVYLLRDYRTPNLNTVWKKYSVAKHITIQCCVNYRSSGVHPSPRTRPGTRTGSNTCYIRSIRYWLTSRSGYKKTWVWSDSAVHIVQTTNCKQTAEYICGHKVVPDDLHEWVPMLRRWGVKEQTMDLWRENLIQRLSQGFVHSHWHK